MSFLTRVLVDKKTAARKRLVDSYAWHKVFWNAFPELEKRDFLTRIEDQDDRFCAFIISETAPAPLDWGKWQTKEIKPSFLEHARYRFRLCANPTYKRKSDGRRLGLFDREKLEEWVRRKAEQSGFSFEAVQIGASVDQPFFKDGERGLHKRVDVEGVLRVQDREKFSAAFVKGIGSAKAFGFGMLVLQPLE